MPIPAGYVQLKTGMWTKSSDASGPYFYDGTSMVLSSPSGGNIIDMTALAGLTAPGVGPWIANGGVNSTIQVLLTTSSGNGSATVNIEVSNDTLNGTPLAISTVAGIITFALAASPQTDGLTTQGAPWKWVRLNVVAITGTGAKILGFLGN